MPVHPGEILVGTQRGPGCEFGHSLPVVDHHRQSCLVMLCQLGFLNKTTTKNPLTYQNGLHYHHSDNEMLVQREVISTPPALLVWSVSYREKSVRKILGALRVTQQTRDKAGDKFSMLCHPPQPHSSKTKLPSSARVKNGSFYNRNHRASQMRCLKKSLSQIALENRNR